MELNSLVGSVLVRLHCLVIGEATQKNPKISERPIFCGLCAAENVKLAGDGVANYSLPKEADCLDQLGHRENIRIFGVPEDPNEGLTDAPAKIGMSKSKKHISVHHRLASREAARGTHGAEIV